MGSGDWLVGALNVAAYKEKRHQILASEIIDDRSSSAPFIHRHVVPLFWPYVDLTGPVEPPIDIFVTLLPLADPPRKAAKGENDGEHVSWNAHRS